MKFLYSNENLKCLKGNKIKVVIDLNTNSKLKKTNKRVIERK